MKNHSCKDCGKKLRGIDIIKSFIIIYNLLVIINFLVLIPSLKLLGIQAVHGDKHLIAGSGYKSCALFLEVNNRKKHNILLDRANVYRQTDCEGNATITENVLVANEFFSLFQSLYLLSGLFSAIVFFILSFRN